MIFNWGWRDFSSLHRGTASLSCGPGITVTPSKSAPVSRTRRSRVSRACRSRLPSTISYSWTPSSSAPSDSSESGSTGLRRAELGGLYSSNLVISGFNQLHTVHGERLVEQVAPGHDVAAQAVRAEGVQEG